MYINKISLTLELMQHLQKFRIKAEPNLTNKYIFFNNFINITKLVHLETLFNI
jgi:hypothetical protein